MRRCHSIVLIALLILISVPAQAAKKRLAFVPVVSSNYSSRNVNLVQNKVEAALEENKAKIVPREDIINYFLEEAAVEPQISEGDALYLEAKQSYLQFQTKSALKSLDKAFEEYEKYPGTSGGAFRAHLLKGLIEMERGQTSKARKTVIKAIESFPGKKSLKDSFFPPRYRQLYSATRARYIKDNPLVEVVVQVVGKDRRSPVFMNGMLTSRGPTVTVLALPDQIITLQAGQWGKAYRVRPKEEGENSVRIRGKYLKGGKGTSLGFGANVPNLVQESQLLGRKVDSYRVVLAHMHKVKGKQHITLTVVDSANGKVTDPKLFELASLKKDIDEAAGLMAQYLTSLKKKDFKKASSDGLPILVGEKKGNAVLYAIIGAVVVGAAVGGVLAFSGGSGSTSSDITVVIEDLDTF